MTRYLATLLVVSAVAVPCVARAQNPQPAPPGVQSTPMAPPNSPSPPPEKVAPGGLDAQADNQTLSDRLAVQHGMLHPPNSVDPDMTVTPPAQAGTMPVIPPPGSPGGDQHMVPK